MAILKKIIWVIFSIMIIFVLMLSYLFFVRLNDLMLHNRHVRKLKSYYENHEIIDDAQFYDFDISDPSIKLNHIQMLATHNSYKKTGPALGRFFVGLGDSFESARALAYGYQNLTAQFELGIRSMEFDIRYRKDRFEITHVPLVDSSSVAVNLETALTEIKYYTEHHRSHIPMIFILEIKDDWMVLDPMLKNVTTNELIELNQLIINQLGPYLITPNDIIKEGLTLRETIADFGWPSVEELLGKVMFVIHAGKYAEMAYQMDTSLASQSFFIGAYKEDQHKDYASFFIHNTPNMDSILPLVQSNFMVRTRVDEDLLFDQNRFNLAKESKANILTSDFLIGRSDLDENQFIYFDGKKMMRLIP